MYDTNKRLEECKGTRDQQTMHTLNNILYLHFLFPGKYEDKLNTVIFEGAYIRNMAVR